MEYTQNYALRKPGLNEYANVGDLNFNADKIDSQMKKNQDVDGEVYDPTTTSANAYEAGDYVINPDDGLMYVCNGTTYGTWDATKWDHTTEFEELQKAMASGGESELADLHDVDITNPTEGQVLTYDEQNDEWVNSDLPDADVTKTASGNPIEFSDGADAPLVKCVTAITGYQSGSGTPSPDNIRPIVAYTEGEIEVGNKNILDKSEIVQGALNDTTGNVSSNNKRVTTGYDSVDSETEYTVSIETGKKVAVVCCYRSDKSFISVATVDSYGTSGDRFYLIFTTVADTAFVRSTFLKDDATANITPSEVISPQLEKGNTPTSYVPYDPDKPTTTHTATFSNSIYQGNADFVGSTASGEWLYDKGGTRGTIDSSGKLYKVRDLNDSDFTQAGSVANMITSHFPVLSLEGARAANYPCACKYGVTVYIGGYVGDEATLDAILPNLEFAYKTATDVTETITPTNLPIKSLFGYNHIESSTGEMEIEYFPAKEQPIIDLIKSDTVDTQEILYIAPDMNDTEITIDLTAYDEYVFYANDVVISSQIPQGNSFPKVVFTQLTANNSIGIYGFENCSCIYTYANGKLTYSSGRGGYKITMIVGIKRGGTTQYITPSQQRSLAKSAPQEETKEEQVEELKEEPTEETKEEPTEEVKEEPEELKEKIKEEEPKEPEDPEIKETNEEEAKR